MVLRVVGTNLFLIITPNKMIKLCKDCKYYKIDKHLGTIDGSHEEDCQHPKNTFSGPKDLINGRMVTYQKWSPKYMRKQDLLVSIFDGVCGKRGRWFRQKPIIIEVSAETFNQLRSID